MRIRLVALMAVVSALVVVPVGQAWAATMVLTPNMGRSGASVLVVAVGFPWNTPIEICWDEPGCDDLGTGKTSAIGGVHKTFKVPNAEPGRHLVYLCTTSGDVCEQAGFEVLPDEPIVTTTTLSPPSTTLPPTTTTLPPPPAIATTTTTTPPATTTTTRPTTTTTRPPTTEPSNATDAEPSSTSSSTTSTTRPRPSTDIDVGDAAIASPPSDSDPPSQPEESSSDAASESTASAPNGGGRLATVGFLSSGDLQAAVVPASEGLIDVFDESRVLQWIGRRLPEGTAEVVLGPLMVLSVLLRALVSAGAGLVAPLSLLGTYVLFAGFDRRRGGQGAPGIRKLGLVFGGLFR